MKAILLSFITSYFIMMNAFAAKVEVTFTDPDKYIDIREGDKNQHSFREEVFYNLTKQLEVFAKKLPEDQLLKVDFSNIDLAGDIRMVDMNLIRVISQLYSPRLRFSYQLVDAAGHVILQGEEDIHDKHFMQSSNSRYEREAYGYEKKILADWFKDTLSEYQVKK